MSDEILAAFAAETAELLETLEISIRELEEGRPGAFDALFRAVHTMKGSASIVGLPRLEAFSHAVESRLARLRSGEVRARAGLGGALLACRDRMAAMLAEGSSGPKGLSEEELGFLAALDESIEEGREAPAETEAPKPVENEPSASSVGFSRVANVKLDIILEEASELSQALSELGRRLKDSAEYSLVEEALSIHALAARHYRSVLAARTVPFGEVAERYRRAVLDIARESGKDIACEIAGGETEIDKALADKLTEPLLHLARNAADHGIEAPETRMAAGKDRRGKIVFSARRDAGSLVVRVEDNGRGVDPAAIRKRAQGSGLLSALKGSDEELLSLLLLPGFSLSSEVTKWSGRGVGLDAVAKSVRMARGSMRLENRLGSGFAGEMRFPLALSLVEGFTAVVGETALLVPFDSVLHCETFEDDGGSGATRTIALDEGLLPAVDLASLYEGGSGADRVAIVVESGGERAAIIVDGVGEAISAAVRPLDRRYADSPGVSGMAALGDGSLVLVLDAPELVRMAAAKGDARRRP
jgi:two-component system, chemotaxis family, sensor kinase CheA